MYRKGTNAVQIPFKIARKASKCNINGYTLRDSKVLLDSNIPIFYSNLLIFNYFPIQNFPKMFPKTSSVEISPVMLPRW